MPSLAEAVEWAESRGNPNALSPKGAMGLMQLMPGTARDPGFGVKGTDNPWDPQENRRVGRAYLDAMKERYGGDQQAALAAYNWGPGNVDDWIAGGRDPNALPAETRNYIASVTGRAGQQQGQSDMPQISDLNDPRLTRAMTTPQPRPLPAQGMPGPMTSALASGGVAANVPQGGGPLSQAMAGGQAQPQPQPQQQPQTMPQQQPQTMPQQQPTGGMQGGQQDGNMLSRLFGDPGFMQGLTVLGGGLEGQGLGTALTQSQQTRAGQMEIQREEERRKRWAQMFSGGERPPILQGLPDETVAAIQALGPDQGRKVLGQILLQRGKGRDPMKLGKDDRLVDPATGEEIAGMATSGDPQAALQDRFGKPPSGYRWIMGQDNQPSLEAIQGGPATKLSAEVAGRLAALETAKNEFQNVKDYFGGDAYSLGSRINKVLNRGEAGRMERSVKLAVEAALRAMTGAAAPEEEVRNYMNMFAPSFDDHPATTRDKLARLEAFMTNAEQVINRGRGGAAPPAPDDQTQPTPNAAGQQGGTAGADPNDPLGIR